jgi:hypothetical protein
VRASRRPAHRLRDNPLRQPRPPLPARTQTRTSAGGADRETYETRGPSASAALSFDRTIIVRREPTCETLTSTSADCDLILRLYVGFFSALPPLHPTPTPFARSYFFPPLSLLLQENVRFIELTLPAFSPFAPPPLRHYLALALAFGSH